MTGTQLWHIFLSANVPTEQLKTLGYDLFHGKPTPEGNAAQAVESMSKILGMPPAFAYKAFNCVQGGILEKKSLLEQLAWDYQHKKTWGSQNALEAVAPHTVAYIEMVAHRITVIKDAMAKQGQPPPPSGGIQVESVHQKQVAGKAAAVPAKARVAIDVVDETKRDWRPMLLFFVGGTIASFILSIRNTHHRYSAA